MSETHVGKFGALVETTARVLSWNVWWRYGPWEARAEPIIAEIARHAPDVVCLQEVWGEGATSFAAQVAARLGFHHVYGPGTEREGIGFGNAVLSRWPIAREETRRLPAGEQPDERRVVVHALVDGPRGRLPVYCTHLNWQTAHGAVRQRQVRFVCEMVAAAPSERCPPVWCGDFNAEPESDEMRMLVGLGAVPVPDLVFRDAWRAITGQGPGYTWDNRNPFLRTELERDRRIDYVLVGEPRESGVGHVTGCRLAGDAPVDPERPDGLWPSDHFGLVADIRY